MRITKKGFMRVAAFAAALALSVGALSGCGQDTSDKDEQGRTILKVGGWPTKEGASLDAIEERKERFEAANTDVVIERDFWRFDRKTFYAKAAGGQLPGVYEAGFTEMPEIIDAEYSADLTDVLKKRGIYDMIKPEIRDALSKDGRIYALPKAASILGIGYNTELFKEAGLMAEDGTPMVPKDWDEFVEFAIKIKEETGEAGVVFPTSQHGGWFFTVIGWSFGVDFMEKDENGKWQATFNTPEAIEAMQWIRDLKWKHNVVPAQSLVDANTWWEIFGTGKAGMTLTPPGMVTENVVKYGMSPMQAGMFGMPAGPKRNVTLISGGVYCVNPEATEDQIDAAVRWLETSVSYNVTDEYKKNKELEIANYVADNRQVGIKDFSIWNGDSPACQFEHSVIDKYINTNPNFIKPFNDYVENCPAEIQEEEPVCCQELYLLLGNCIQELFTNKDADVAELLEKANSDFQSNYLDNLTY